MPSCRGGKPFIGARVVFFVVLAAEEAFQMAFFRLKGCSTSGNLLSVKMHALRDFARFIIWMPAPRGGIGLHWRPLPARPPPPGGRLGVLLAFERIKADEERDIIVFRGKCMHFILSQNSINNWICFADALLSLGFPLLT